MLKFFKSAPPTPDEMLAGAIVQLFASEFDEWQLTESAGAFTVGVDESNHAYQVGGCSGKIIHAKRKLTIACIYGHTGKWVGPSHSQKFVTKASNFTINGDEINAEMTAFIRNSWNKIAAAQAKAKGVAAKALQEMEASERKWNMVENLLGLTRNEQGALIPKEKHDG